jgi:hypothetical protein
VDAHVGLAQFPEGLDGWRLWQYLESKSIPGLSFRGEFFASDDESALDAMLAKLAAFGHLAMAPMVPPLFVPPA